MGSILTSFSDTALVCLEWTPMGLLRPFFDLMTLACGFLLELMKFALTGVNQVGGWLFSILETCSLYESRNLDSLKNYIRGALNALQRMIPRSPWFMSFLFYIMRKGVSIVVLLVTFIAQILPWATIYAMLLIIVWYGFLFPILMQMEENPSLFTETLYLVFDFFGSVFNIFTALWNLVVSIINPILPLTWQIITEMYLEYALYYEWILHQIGLSPNFEYSGTSGGSGEAAQFTDGILGLAKATDLARGVGERSLLFVANPVTSGVSTFFLDESQVASGIITPIITAAFSLTELYFTVRLVFIEFFLKTISDGFDILKSIIKIASNTICAGPTPLCAAREFFVGFVNDLASRFGINDLLSFFGFKPILLLGCNDADLNAAYPGFTSSHCSCSAIEGGLYENQSPCQGHSYVCIAEVNASGDLVFTEYLSVNGQQTGGPVTASKYKELGCPFSSPSTRLRARVLFGAKESRCYKHCVTKKGVRVGWAFEACGEVKTFRGACDVEEWAGKKGVEDGRVILLTREREERFLADYLEWAPKEKGKVKGSMGAPAQQGPSSHPIIKKLDFQLMMEAVETRPITDAQLGMECSASSEEWVFKEMVFRVACMVKKLTFGPSPAYSLPPHKRRRTTGEDGEDIYVPWGREEEEPDQKKEVKKPDFSSSVLSLMSDLLEVVKNVSSNSSITWNHPSSMAEGIDLFHDGILEVHRRHLSSLSPNGLFRAGRHRGLFTKVMTNLTNEIFSPRPEEKTEKRGRVLFDSADTGLAQFKCGLTGKMCPDKQTCAPDGILARCTWPTEYDAGVVIRLVPYIAATALEKLDFRVFINDVFSCWKQISSNRQQNPATAYIELDAFTTPNSPIPDGVLFCFPLIPPLPLAPEFTWNAKKFISNMCGEELSQKNCVCPQYFNGLVEGDVTSQWIKGIPFAEFARIFNAYKATQFLVTRVVPQFLSSMWYTFVTSIFCASDQCPQVANVFNAEFASAGLSDDANYFCIAFHIASILYTLLFYIFPLLIVLWKGYRLIWEVVSIPLDFIAYPLFSVFNYLTLIQSSYQVVRTKRREKSSFPSSPSTRHLSWRQRAYNYAMRWRKDLSSSRKTPQDIQGQTKEPLLP